MFTSLKLYIILACIAGVLGSTGYAYYKGNKNGYDKAVAYYQPILDKQTAMVHQLEEEQKNTKERIVYKYLTKYVTVTETVERIIRDTSEALKDENKTCVIGPNFISLHNAAANGSPVSNSSGSIDGSAKATNDSAPAN